MWWWESSAYQDLCEASLFTTEWSQNFFAPPDSTWLSFYLSKPSLLSNQCQALAIHKYLYQLLGYFHCWSFHLAFIHLMKPNHFLEYSLQDPDSPGSLHVSQLCTSTRWFIPPCWDFCHDFLDMMCIISSASLKLRSSKTVTRIFSVWYLNWLTQHPVQTGCTITFADKCKN